jgi:hypothetical protein
MIALRRVVAVFDTLPLLLLSVGFLVLAFEGFTQ